jgi:hypothetical protein
MDGAASFRRVSEVANPAQDVPARLAVTSGYTTRV